MLLLVDLGYARLFAKQMPAALRAFEQALDGVSHEDIPPRLLGDLARIYLGLGRYREAEGVFQALATADPDHVLLARHGTTWCLIKQGNWRRALESALEATRLDRFDLTTALLAYAKDRLFTSVPDAARREAELDERFLAELREHEELHAEEAATAMLADALAGQARNG